MFWSREPDLELAVQLTVSSYHGMRGYSVFAGPMQDRTLLGK